MNDHAASTVSKLNLDELKRVGIIAQKQKETFLIRLRTVAGDLSADELNTVAQVSRKFAGSRVHLTTRQAVEIHNIHLNDLQAAREELEAGGIVLGVCGPRGRGIVACPGSATCTSGIIETKELAAELDAVYFRVPAPHKFKIGISGCPNNCSKPVENDIGIMGGVLPGWDREVCISCRLCVNICPAQAIAHQEKEFVLDREKCLLCGLCIRNCPKSAWKAARTGYTLYFGGTMGLKPRLGTRAKTLIESKEEVLSHVKRAFDYYGAHGRKKERFGHMLDRIGPDRAFADIFSEKEQAPKADESSESRSSVKRNFLDLRGVSCPLNFVKAKLAIDRIGSGETIEFHLDDGEPLVNVTRSLKDEGHQVLLVTPRQNYFEVMVEKKN
ncbi:MAG: hypothetical protein A2078_00980 [Nitrospirae bacterium GWC2_57_9]|nr:MAG: hypothetical protein A2078_00980 [Nitrospirae bacterium GWC2_57_9]